MSDEHDSCGALGVTPGLREFTMYQIVEHEMSIKEAC